MSDTFLCDTQPKARKTHECYLCGQTIVIGEKHVKRCGVYEGDFQSVRMHERCEQVTRKWPNEYWETEPDAREFILEMEEYYARKGGKA